jgi:hypothetical protein
VTDLISPENLNAALGQAVCDEQEQLWGDMTTAIRTAHNRSWSTQCENLAYRIVTLARLVGATRWSAVDSVLIRSGVYERILTEAGIRYEPIDWAAVAANEAYIARSAQI